MGRMLELLRLRRSVRKFTSEQVPRELQNQLCEALLRSPSSRGRNPWEFVLVDNPQLLEQLSRVKAHGAAFLAEAPLAIVVAADPDISDVWVEDCAIAAILLQVTAESLGLKSCWAQVRLRLDADGRDAEAVLRGLVGLPERYRTTCIIGVGYPAEEKPGHPEADLPHNKIHRNSY